MGGSKPQKKDNTKLKKFIYQNKIFIPDLVVMTRKADKDGYGLAQCHLYQILNDKITPKINTMIIIADALSIMLDMVVPLDDLVERRKQIKKTVDV